MNQNSGPSLSSELNSFVYGVSRRHFQIAPELTKSGLSLLRNFPAARDAVLEYFALVFHDAVNYCISPAEVDDNGQSYPSLDAVNQIGTEFCNLNKSWASIVAPWCLGLLKDIAINLSSVSITTLQSSDPVRILLDIATANLTKLDENERARCIDIMLTSSQCDWVVGCVGRCDPSLVVPRVVQLGVQDDARHNIDHVVATLSHLSTMHSSHIRDALMDLFHESLSDTSKVERRQDIIPYLLQLAYKSDTVLKALTQDIHSVLTEITLERLTKSISCMSKTPSWESVTPALLVSLCLRSEASTFTLILRYASKNLYCRQLLEYLLQRLESDVCNQDKQPELIESMVEGIGPLRAKIINGNILEQYSVARVIILICYYYPWEFVNTISYLLQQSKTDTSLALLVRIISTTMLMRASNNSLENIKSDSDKSLILLKHGIEKSLTEACLTDRMIKKCFVRESENAPEKTYLHQLCLNIDKILKWENSNKIVYLQSKPVSKACNSAFMKFIETFSQCVSYFTDTVYATMSSVDIMSTCHAMSDLIQHIASVNSRAVPLGVEVVLKMIQSGVKYFFKCLSEEDVAKQACGVARCRGWWRCGVSSRGPRSAALRALLSGAVIYHHNIFTNKEQQNQKDTQLLIHLNNMQGPITQLAQSHTSVFHAGIIGNGVRKLNNQPNDDINDKIIKETELLCGTLMACMEDSNSGLVDGMTTISLLLVELISPDVMYNGLPWPDEDFTKVSIERELYMRGALSRSPVCARGVKWAARVRPAVCVASCVVRAACAVCVHGPYPPKRLPNYLMEVMSLAQLLPHPICYAPLTLQHLSSAEIIQVLRDCVWNYTRDHVPSPTLFSCDSTGLHWRDPTTFRPPSIYTDTLRILIQKNIAKLGHLYPIMFLSLEKEL